MEYVHIVGTVDENGRFTPGWWSTPSAEAVRAVRYPPDSETSWAAVALDEEDRILARAPASLVVAPICPGEPRFGFETLLPLPDTTSSVAIMDGDRKAFRRAVPEPSRLRLDRRLGTRPRRRSIAVRIGVDGPDPPPGAYIVARWEAPGHPPLPLGLVAAGSGEPPVLRLDLTDLPGGEGCRMLVTYGDGIRTVTVSSEPLSVAPRPARPVILAPGPGLALFDDGWLSLEGRLDGDGDAGALEWLLDDERVGTGTRAGVARPGAGTRTVTLRHGSARSSVEVEVLPAPAEAPREWAPPWRSAPFRSVSPLEPKADNRPER